GVLYAGTERGVYLSLDDGATWRPFQLNLPVVPITDLAIKNNDLVVATQGRSFWVLDDLTPLHQLRPELAKQTLHLFAPRPAYPAPGGGGFGSRTEGQNPPGGVVFQFHLRDEPPKGSAVTFEVLEASGALIRRFSTKGDAPADTERKGGRGRGGPA